jgi:hypothetical protein
MVVFFEISNTGDLTLLSDEETPIEELAEIWENLEQKHQELSGNTNANKVFNLSKEIEFQANRYEIIHNCCEALAFDQNDDLIAILREYGYTINDTNYINDLNKIVRLSEGILTRINQLRDSLPKQSNSQQESSIVDVMASYAAILGFDFDFFLCSVEKFYALEKMVKAKIKSIESSNKKSKKK